MNYKKIFLIVVIAIAYVACSKSDKSEQNEYIPTKIDTPNYPAFPQFIPNWRTTLSEFLDYSADPQTDTEVRVVGPSHNPLFIEIKRGRTYWMFYFNGKSIAYFTRLPNLKQPINATDDVIEDIINGATKVVELKKESYPDSYDLAAIFQDTFIIINLKLIEGEYMITGTHYLPNTRINRQHYGLN